MKSLIAPMTAERRWSASEVDDRGDHSERAGAAAMAVLALYYRPLCTFFVGRVKRPGMLGHLLLLVTFVFDVPFKIMWGSPEFILEHRVERIQLL